MELPTLSPGLQAKRQFRAFNTDVSIEAADWTLAALLGGIEAFFHAFEARFSRFREDSELTGINRRTADAVAVSPEMLELLDRCQQFFQLTAGVFNPLVLRSLETAGYDRSFELLPDHTAAAQSPPPVPPLSLLQLDLQRSQIRLPLPLGLDFGGIGKGYAVDKAAALLARSLPWAARERPLRAAAAERGLGGESGFLIDAGGDIYAAGCGPDGQPWHIEVADPLNPEDALATVKLQDEAIATSWATKRRWRAGGGWGHHLIDPRSGEPARSGVIGATVIAAAADEADVFAKTALILGAETGIAFLKEQGVEGLLVLEDGSHVQTSTWTADRRLENTTTRR